MDEEKALQGAKIVVNQWLKANNRNKILIVTDETHRQEGLLIKSVSDDNGNKTDIMVTGQNGKLVGMHFDNHPYIFKGYDYIIGATDYSLVTTLAAKTAISNGSGYLSLPLHTNNGKSMLEFDFMRCDTSKAKFLADLLIKKLNNCSVIHATTQLGTDMYFYKKDRDAKFFNGVLTDCSRYSSASIEVYVPIEESKTYGKLILDGSLGYIGAVTTPLQILFSNGKITQIEDSPDGKRLKNFISDYCDDNMYTASEFGIGLNELSHCCGNCYIEDESALGTFHIGFGRNLALGGFLKANGHFDLTTHKPDIYADGVKIMHQGKIIF